MNLNRAESTALATGVAERVSGDVAVDVAICPPTVYLDAVVAASKGSPVAVGAQNIYHVASGAYTVPRHEVPPSPPNFCG